MKKKIVLIILSVCLIIGTFFGLQQLLIPKYISDVIEGNLIESYYDEEVKDHDVLFVGDCEVYENFSPITLWQEYGITSYIRGSAQQLIWQSYYLLEDTLRYEKPDVVVFNVLSMKYDKPQNEAYNRMSIDGMEWSKSKWDNILASMMEDESIIDYIFPLLRYHTRWSELTEDDFQYAFSTKPKQFHNGFIMRADVLPVTTIPEANKLANYEFGENSYKYLDMMTKLCKENDIELVLIKAPSLYPYWYDEWDQQMVEYADENDLYYINFLDYIDEIGLDFSTDTYDAGLHLNLSGAEKLSQYFGKLLQDKYKIEDKRNDEDCQKIWDEKVDFYEEMKLQQLSELEKYGYLKSLKEK
ncbi:MAG: SGNH/GDSL hydrolase family protein [Bacilli bacterium]|nr:SGNH/GDSL hydrolase family protein [Bacilli bacterium]